MMYACSLSVLAPVNAVPCSIHSPLYHCYRYCSPLSPRALIPYSRVYPLVYQVRCPPTCPYQRLTNMLSTYRHIASTLLLCIAVQTSFRLSRNHHEYANIM